MEMGKLRIRLHSLQLKLKSPSLVPAKSIRAVKQLRRRRALNKNRRGLVKLYREMEGSEGYSDIKVMWEMIHSSYHAQAQGMSHQIRGRAGNRNFHWNFCFTPAA